jgi:hypothetical protein
VSCPESPRIWDRAPSWPDWSAGYPPSPDIEQLADGSQVLFDARLSNFGAQLLDICGDGDGLDVLQPEMVLITPVEEAFYRARVRRPRIAVADGRGKEFDEATAGAFTLGADNRRQAFEPDADQRGRRYDFFA